MAKLEAPPNNRSAAIAQVSELRQNDGDLAALQPPRESSFHREASRGAEGDLSQAHAPKSHTPLSLGIEKLFSGVMRAAIHRPPVLDTPPVLDKRSAYTADYTHDGLTGALTAIRRAHISLDEGFVPSADVFLRLAANNIEFSRMPTNTKDELLGLCEDLREALQGMMGRGMMRQGMTRQSIARNN